MELSAHEKAAQLGQRRSKEFQERETTTIELSPAVRALQKIVGWVDLLHETEFSELDGDFKNRIKFLFEKVDEFNSQFSGTLPEISPVMISIMVGDQRVGVTLRTDTRQLFLQIDPVTILGQLSLE